MALHVVTRDVFFALTDLFTLKEGLWYAVCVFIPPEWAHELNLSEESNTAMQNRVLECCVALKNTGFVSQISYLSYFLLIKSDYKEDWEKWCREKINISEKPEIPYSLWRCDSILVEKKNYSLIDIFTSLEVDAFDKARSDPPDLSENNKK